MERQPSRRPRPVLSCLECRRKKKKCDRNSPCKQCVTARTRCAYNSYGDEPDTQPQRREGSLPLASNPLNDPPPPRTSAGRPNGQYGNRMTGSPIVAEILGQDDIPDTLGCNDTQRLNRASSTDSVLHNLSQRVQNLEKTSASRPIHGPSGASQGLVAYRSGLQSPRDAQISVNKTRISGWSLRMATARELEPVLACYTEALGNDRQISSQATETGILTGQIRQLLRECKSIARSTKVGRPSRCLSCPKFDLIFPPRDLADRMATSYFRSFESTHRILHVPSFWGDYQRYWYHPESAPTDLRLKILLVIGLGSSIHGHEDTDARFREMVPQWVYAAQTWLSGPLEKDRLGIAGLQIHCLTILARQVFSIGGDLVWMSMGSLIHQAMQIGLHRDPKHLPSMSVLQSELRRRLWATILEMAAQSSLDSTMPPRISLDEFDTEAPSNVNDSEIAESTTTLQPHPKSTYTMTSIQLVLLDSLPTRLRILQLATSLHSELSYTDVLELSSKVTDAYRTCSSFMNENKVNGVTSFHRNLLDYSVYRFMIPLHSPFVVRARTNPLFYYSLKVSLDLAMTIISPEPDQGFFRLMTIGGGFFKEGIRYAGAIICFELLGQVEAQRLDGTLHRSSQYKESLKRTVMDMIALSSERIQQGETNVKSHMFLSMVMAQAEAIESGSPCELKIAQSAKDSLEFCRGLLQPRVGSDSLPCPTHTSPESIDFDDAQQGSGLDLDLDFFLPDVGFC